MAIVQFKYYLHDNSESYERNDWISQQTGVEIGEELADMMGKPFSEVELTCTLNTATGEVRILGVTG